MKSPLHRLALCIPFAVLLLAACGTPSPAARAGAAVEQEHADSCENPGADQCIVLACAGEDEVCGVFDCEDVTPEPEFQTSLNPGVELAMARPPMRGPGPFRNWRRMGLRQGALPKVTFHFRYRHGFLPAFPRYTGKVVKHHLLPQAKEFREWFRKAGINIHEYTLLIPEHVHQRIHSGDGRGGLWNEAWRNYRDAHPSPPSREAILRHAFDMAFRFRLMGPLMPYSHPIVPIGPQLFSN